jgi:hypothetical protein
MHPPQLPPQPSDPHDSLQNGVHPQTPGCPPPPQVSKPSQVPHDPPQPSEPQFLPAQFGEQHMLL